MRADLQKSRDELKAAQKDLEEARIKQASNAKVSPAVSSLRQKLKDAEELMLGLQQQGDSDNKQRLDLQMKIELYKETLQTLRFSEAEDSFDDDSSIGVAIACSLVSV